MKTGKQFWAGKIVIALAAWALMSGGSWAQVAATAQKAAPAAQSARTAADDATTDFTLANGLKVIHRFVKGNEVVAARVYFRGGARNINEKNAGIETLLFEVAQAGTKNFTKSQINRELARMGTVVNSGGGYDYSVLASLSVRQHFDRSWQLLTDMALYPTFDEKEVTLERDRLVNALRQEGDDPETYVTSQSEKLLYAAHPYSNRPFGTIESVGRLTAADLKAYHAAHLMASRLLVVVVGNVTQDEVRRKVEAAFGKLPKGDYKPEPPPAFKPVETPEFKLIERGVPTYYIRGVFAAPSIGDPDYAALMVATNIIYQQFFQEVRVKRNLSYAPNIELLTQGANSGFISVSTPKPNEALKVMFDQIELIQQNVIRKEALPEILTGFLTTYYRNLETNDAQAARLGEYELLAGDWRKALTWIEDVNKVTPEDINRVANKYLKTFRFAVIGDKAAFDQSLFMSK
jgi:zinc protease